MLVDEEELQESRVAPLDQDEPRRGGEEEGRKSRTQEERTDKTGAPRGHAPEKKDRPWQNHGDESLGQESSSGREPGQERQSPPAQLLLSPRDRRAREKERRGEEESERRVGQIDSREGESEGSREKEDPRRETGLEAPGGRDAEDQGRDCAEAEEARRKPGRPRVDAEESDRSGVGPVVKRRFLEVGYAVQSRRHEVVGGEHLARDLGVPRLVRLGQPGARRLDPDGNGKKHQRSQENPPVARAQGVPSLTN